MPQTGATRYQKFLKSEKAKTKLKSKKELPKGTNVTKTNFKVKKIVIKEQLKKYAENEKLSIRKLNIKELILRLNHFNVNSRTDALDGIKQVVTAFPDVLDKNLGELIHGLTPLILNIEKQVRRESLKVLHLILSAANVQKLEPFFDVMSTYLRSAMTHIDSRIQEDSLLFLDILLLHAADRVAKDFHKIIPNFLDMISKIRETSKPERTLTVNLNSQFTSVKWRVKVLHRLQEFLYRFIACNKKRNVNENLTRHTNFFNSGKCNVFPLANTSYVANCVLPIFSSKSSESVLTDEIETFKCYIDTLMPLLFATWLEVCPNTNTNKPVETVLSEDAAVLLKHIVQVISLIWELVEDLQKKTGRSNIKSMFCDKYRTPFTNHFVKPFPFVTNVRSNKIKAVSNISLTFEDVIADPKMMEQNLIICHMFVKLHPNVNIKTQSKEVTSVLNFIEKTINQSSQDDIYNLVVDVLQTIFSIEVTGWTKNLTIMDALFRKIIWAFFNKNLSNSFQQKIFALLCKIGLNDKLTHFHATDAYEKWLNYLPDVLLQDAITVQTIDILHKFAVCNCNVFNIVMRPKLLRIIENLPKIKVSDSSDTEAYVKLYSLLYWIKLWDNESLNLLEQQLLRNTYDTIVNSDCSMFVYNTLHLKSTGVFA